MGGFRMEMLLASDYKWIGFQEVSKFQVAFYAEFALAPYAVVGYVFSLAKQSKTAAVAELPHQLSDCARGFWQTRYSPLRGSGNFSLSSGNPRSVRLCQRKGRQSYKMHSGASSLAV